MVWKACFRCQECGHIMEGHYSELRNVRAAPECCEKCGWQDWIFGKCQFSPNELEWKEETFGLLKAKKLEDE